MSTENYRVFYQVAESGSISRAAQALFVSQPAVTKSIKTLERELGVILFQRQSQGVELTSEGKLLFDYVQKALNQIDQGEKLIRQMKDRELGTVRIGISNTLCKYYFIPHLSAFHDAFPQIKIEIVNRTSPETMHLLENNSLDCAIISELTFSSELAYMRLMEIQDTFVAKEMPPQELLPIKELENYPMLLLEKKNATRRYLEDFFIQHQTQLNVEIEISSMEFLVEFAKIGLGVSAVIRNFVEDEISAGLLHEWKIEPPLPPRSIGMVYMRRTGLSIASQTFIDFMAKRS